MNSQKIGLLNISINNSTRFFNVLFSDINILAFHEYELISGSNEVNNQFFWSNMLKNNSIDTKPEYIYEKLKNYNNISDIYYNPLYYEKYNPTLIENKIMFTKIPYSHNNTYKNNGFDDALLRSNEIILHKKI
jgi:hypothetical protein